jgi:16S rRNA (uracil1498-N3)-methyltransferase
MPGHFNFYTTKIQGLGALFEETEYGHAIRTLRYKMGDEIHFTDGLGKAYLGKISTIEKQHFFADILNSNFGEARPGLTIYSGIIKSTDRMEWLVEKCTELGVAKLVFIKMQKAERSKLNLERLHKTAVAAMKQSHRNWLPEIAECSWDDMLNTMHSLKYIALIPKSGETQTGSPIAEDTAVLLGPEGDFSTKELTEAVSCGFKPLGLGTAVLRTETAAMAAAAWYSLMHLGTLR